MPEPVPNFDLAQRITSRGWTYARVAELINQHVETATGRANYTEESIRRLLRGHHTWPWPPYREAMCAMFDCEPSDLGFFNPRAARTVNRKDHEEDDVRRMDFLRGAAALPIAAALPTQVRDAAVQPATPIPPSAVGMEHVHRVNAWSALFRAADDAGLGLAEAAQLRVAHSYLQARMPPHVESEMRGAVATFYRVVGWARYDRGEHTAARDDFNHGWDLVKDDGAWWIRAAILTCVARQSIYRGDVEDALNMLGMASIRADKLSLLRRADIAAVKARAFGHQGNHRECVRAVLEAEQLFTEAADEDHPDTAHEGFKTYYTHRLLASDLAQGLFELAFTRGTEVPLTLERLRTAGQMSDEHARSRLLSTANLAALQLRRGDVDEGVTLGTTVVEKAHGTTSVRVADDLKRIYQLTKAPHIKNARGVPQLRAATYDLLRTL